MKFKKLGKALLFPHIAIMIILIPISTVFLIYSMIFWETKSITAIISYVIAFYTLVVWCFKIPYLINFFKIFKNENKFAIIWQDDTRLRVNISLYGTLFWNTAYALLQLGMGVWHHTFWFYSLAGYYLSLAVMRFFLVRHTRKYKSGENMLDELRKYRACGIVFLIMNLALSLIIFFMVYWNRTFNHHEITTIALATYTFTSFTLAIVNIVKYRKYQSPVYSASKAISLASSCVSMLTLESTMLTTFGNETMNLTARRILLGTSGGVISLFIIVMAIYMIVMGNKKISLLIHQRSNLMENKETFQFTYSAKEQQEIKAIRQKYVVPEKNEDKMAHLRRLDTNVTQKATTISLVFGIVGALILGFGMSLAMTELGDILGFHKVITMLIGIVIGIIGIVLVCLAYPIYNRTLKNEREKIAPEIIRLTDELMK